MNHPHYRFSRRPRPAWWPENEPWPPQRPMRPMRRYPFFRRMGCMFALFSAILWCFPLIIIVSLAQALGWVTIPRAPVPVDVPALLAVVLTAVIAVAVMVHLVRRFFLPLDNLVEAADRVARGDYSVRVDEGGPRAVRSLAQAFNNMAARLDSTMADRRNLLADVTHEMRTPLTVMQGNLEGMLDGLYPADPANLRAVLDETTLLARLISDLQTLALAETGALQLKLEPTDLEVLIHDVAGGFQAQAASAGVSLDLEVAPETPSLQLDAGRIRQVLTNLLANAMRYTPAGGSVQVACRAQSAHVIIEVRDTGAGISPEDLPHVFDRFYRSSDSGGMGLGLAIARHLVEAHGGTLTAVSVPGRGTAMEIRLPVAR
jgi:two-component system, OmpR family, sensor histidine kinase BaeS